MSEQDTREQLEADIERYLSQAGCHEMVCGWLDRQAAITERETRAIRCFACNWADERAELTAERDELIAAIDAMNNGQFYYVYKAKCDECEQLKKVVRTQADSFKKLEIELAGKDG